MAERFGSQAHPLGGLRFGSQTYAAISAAAGDFAAVETGDDVFAADSYPRINGALDATESGQDVLAASGSSSLLFTMQAVESPTPDGFVSFGGVTTASLRFGSQAHPLGGLRFGSQSWAALGPSGALAATESGADSAAADGWLEDSATYSFALFDILAEFVDYSSESLGAAVTGTLDTGYKVLLPVAAIGISFTWEVNSAGNPSLRLENLTGANVLTGIPWYVWNGSAWTAASFSVSDAMQGAVFMVESGADIFLANASETRFGAAAIIEIEGDFAEGAGAVAVGGALSIAEGAAADTFSASGAPEYIGTMDALDDGEDTLAASAVVIVSSSISLVESAVQDVFAALGHLSSAGSLAATEAGSDALAAFGFVTFSGALAAAEEATADAATAIGEVHVSGALALVESSADAFAASAQLERAGIVTLLETGNDALSIDGALLVAGTLAGTDAPDVFACFGVRESTGDVVAAEGGADRFVSRGRSGNVVSIPTVDGPVKAASGTRVVTVRSRHTAEAA